MVAGYNELKTGDIIEAYEVDRGSREAVGPGRLAAVTAAG